MSQYHGSYWLIRRKRYLALVKGIDKSLHLLATNQIPAEIMSMVTKMSICLVNKFKYLDSS